MAAAVGISARAADRHVQDAYAKLGVSARAAVSLLAIEHGLLTWGELLIFPVLMRADVAGFRLSGPGSPSGSTAPSPGILATRPK